MYEVFLEAAVGHGMTDAADDVANQGWEGMWQIDQLAQQFRSRS